MKVVEQRGNAPRAEEQIQVFQSSSKEPLTSAADQKRSANDIPKLRKNWFDKYNDVFQEQPARLPPKRQVEHHIPLVEPDKRYAYYLPKCADYLKVELLEKIKKYTEAGWWVPAAVNQAAPMLCIPKRNKKLRTPIDLRKRNANTHKDVTPFPDQDHIRYDVARAKYRSKIDMTNAYEQILVADSDIAKTAFATIFGTFYSRVMQIGDCNAPATFQTLMTNIFRDYIGRFVHVYLDDIFIYSDSIEEHEKHLDLVFSKLRDNEFYLQEEKVDLYAEKLDCLGHMIDNDGLHVGKDKMETICEWREPRNYNDVQRFLGLIQYISHFLPEVANFTGPLAAMTTNNQPFQWRPVHQKAFDSIKHLCSKTPVLKPIDPRSEEPIWVICDASASGLGAMYGQGPTWDKCRPAGFMSKKFTAAQRNYRVFELETLAILEALLKWEDRLQGYKINIVTDHKALEFFDTQRNLSGRQARWMEVLSRFDYHIQYIEGKRNKVADALSRYYESDTWFDTHQLNVYVNADIRIDKEMDDLPSARVEEVQEDKVKLHATRVVETIEARQSKRLLDKRETRDLEAARIAAGMSPTANATPPPVDDLGENPTVFQSRDRGYNLRRTVFDNHSDLIDSIRSEYDTDPLFSKILKRPDDFTAFKIEHKLIWVKNRGGERVLCVPQGKFGEKSIRGTVLEQAHEVVGHFGPQRTADYVRRWFWWPQMTKDAIAFCESGNSIRCPFQCSLGNRSEWTLLVRFLHGPPHSHSYNDDSERTLRDLHQRGSSSPWSTNFDSLGP